MYNYKMNFATKTLTITKAFAERAMVPNSEEAEMMRHLNNICPGLRTVYKTTSSAERKPHKGLTYERMERYIRMHENANELLIMFSAVKELGRAHSNPYNYVVHWFFETFPDYYEMPVLENGRIATVPIAKVMEVTPIHHDLSA